MKALNLTTWLLVIIGGVNWGLVGLANLDLVAAIFGAGSGLARLVYVLVGVSALWQLYPLTRATQVGQTMAEAGRYSLDRTRRPGRHGGALLI